MWGGWINLAVPIDRTEADFCEHYYKPPQFTYRHLRRLVHRYLYFRFCEWQKASAYSHPSVLQQGVNIWKLFRCRVERNEQFENYVQGILTQLRIPRGDKLLFFFDWFVGFFARKVNLSALMDELRRFIWLHDVTFHRTLPWESCCLDSVLLSHVCNYPKYIPQSTPHNRTELSKHYPYFQQYLFHRPIPVAARSKATILRGLRVRNPP